MPYGPAHLLYTYNDPSKKWRSFEGVGMFCEGKLHMGPFTAIDGDGDGFSFSKMINGRAADSHYHTQFFAPGFTRYLDSKEENSQVGGMMSLSSQM